MANSILAVFETPHEAQMAIQALVDSGIPKSEISLIMPDERFEKNQSQTEAPENLDETRRSSQRVRKGMSTGAIAGGVIGTAAGVGASAIPGVAPAILAGAGLGAIAGGLGGTISDLGLPDNQIEFLNQKLGKGHALIFVRTSNERLELAHEIFSERGALETEFHKDAPAFTRA